MQRNLWKSRIERIEGWFDAHDVAAAGLHRQSFAEVDPEEIAERVADGSVQLIDVRGDAEWHEMHVEQAQRCFLAKLPEQLERFDGDCHLVFQCRSGGRSAIATSLAQAAGVKIPATDVTAGAWDSYAEFGIGTLDVRKKLLPDGSFKLYRI